MVNPIKWTRGLFRVWIFLSVIWGILTVISTSGRMIEKEAIEQYVEALYFYELNTFYVDELETSYGIDFLIIPNPELALSNISEYLKSLSPDELRASLDIMKDTSKPTSTEILFSMYQIHEISSGWSESAKEFLEPKGYLDGYEEKVKPKLDQMAYEIKKPMTRQFIIESASITLMPPILLLVVTLSLWRIFQWIMRGFRQNTQ